MWEKISNKKTHDTMRIFDWINKIVNNEDYIRQARDAIYSAESKLPMISLYRNIPQSVPWHGEGATLMHHIERMLIGLFAVLDEKFNILDIEEFVVEKHLKLELLELQNTIREQAATLEAFIILHDIAKQDVISFNSTAGALGSSEGFNQKSKLSVNQQSQNYLKLVRKYTIENPDLSESELLAKFFEKYKINIHYDGHAQIAVSEQYEKAREIISDSLRLTARDREILRLLIQYHIDSIIFFKQKPDGVKFKLMSSRATKSEIDADDFLDIQLASLFLDAVVGAKIYKNKKWFTDVSVVLNMLNSEELIISGRKVRRRELLKNKNKQEIKDILSIVGLDAESVFQYLDIPFGEKRAGIMQEVKFLISNVNEDIDMKKYDSVMIKKIQKARGLYSIRQT